VHPTSLFDLHRSLFCSPGRRRPWSSRSG
jgi:hypothetical protein